MVRPLQSCLHAHDRLKKVFLDVKFLLDFVKHLVDFLSILSEILTKFRHNSTRVDTMATKYLNLRFKFGGILVSEVGLVYVGDYAKSFRIGKLGKTYAAPSLGGDMMELKNDMDICDISLFMHDGDTIDIYVCHDTILEDVGPTEGQISKSLSQVDLGLDFSSSFPSSGKVENDGIAGVQQETDDGYSSIDWTDTEGEVEPTVQQGTEPSIQEEVEPSAQENAEEDIDNDFICSDQSIDYGSDVHEELRIVKEDVRKFGERYEDIEKGKKKKIKDKLTEDEPYYDSSDCDSFQSDEEHVSDDELEGGSLRREKEE
ncbi:hypothetical protein H5410_045261 [Solanum commersonii]|uniref:Uncharacterized protein n=1 Tax=Solanum commersonii TaxID=4109 RepID=A0A9J5X953_SOLCO|nr:hypothetical protein H5410_045261 [Solanum commersonii]